MTIIKPTIVYTPNYDIRAFGLEKLHPFDSCKYSRTWQQLTQNLGNNLQKILVSPPSPATEQEILSVHTQEYLKTLENSQNLAQALELPPLASLPNFLIAQTVLKPMRWAIKGTIIAAQKALKNGISVNLSGGYHHASKERGEGFCIYSDIAIAIASLRQSAEINANDQVIIIDLDAHQGNGLERIFYEDKNIHIFDMYNQYIYPQDTWARKRINYDVPLNFGTDDQEYLTKLRNHLPQFLSEVSQAKIAFYNAGTDIFGNDPLGGLNVSAEGVFQRDKFVFEQLIQAQIPFVMVLSGGYTQESYLLIAKSVGYLMENWSN